MNEGRAGLNPTTLLAFCKIISFMKAPCAGITPILQTADQGSGYPLSTTKRGIRSHRPPPPTITTFSLSLPFTAPGLDKPPCQWQEEEDLEDKDLPLFATANGHGTGLFTQNDQTSLSQGYAAQEQKRERLGK